MRALVPTVVMLIAHGVGSWSSVQAAEMRPDQIVRRYGRAVVLITTRDTDGSEGFGTGFIVSPNGLVVTNAHVIRDAIRTSVTFTNGRQYPVQRVISRDSSRDVAILKINARRLPTVRLGGSASASVGTRVYVIGNPEGFRNTLSDGLLSAWRYGSTRTLLQISAPVSAGSSGSPVFDSHGRVIGVATLSYSPGQNLNLAIPITYARDLLRRRPAARVRTAKANTSDSDARERKLTETLTRYAIVVHWKCPRLSTETAVETGALAAAASYSHEIDVRLILAALATDKVFDKIEWRDGERWVGDKKLLSFVDELGANLSHWVKDLAADTSGAYGSEDLSDRLLHRRFKTHPDETYGEANRYVDEVGKEYYYMRFMLPPVNLAALFEHETTAGRGSGAE